MTEFVDTNVLLYANGINAAKDPEKVIQAAELLRRKWSDIFITWQVLMEFGANLAKKSKLPLKEKQNLIRIYSALLDQDEPNHPDQIEIALLLQEKKMLSYWDANLLAAVSAQGGTILYSEGMQDGTEYGGVTVRNPFGSIV